ncbi:universal stress protein [Ancylobacter amanitiformis]|uniref:Nucleotide-binding universal stress UspA family protein n=1 Tax=Ancylobacter amanitiformis TaxID=217069 RepID=A0ABU0LVU2_9HYPH|nr:universal stress protein [Ancylobacter amanitiformis]MDQ0512780.1 nucleotide-binding universal stress UspA family protein [Ancylobacter amanitiformis]
MIKDILVSLRIGEGADTAVDYAVSAAAALKAHLTGVAISYEIDIPPIYTEAFSTDFLETQRAEGQKLAERAVSYFGEATRSLGVNAEIRSIDGTPGGAAEQVGILSRLYDLTIVGQADPDRPGAEEVIAEAVLFDSGRPVLLIPVNQQKPFSAKRILVAWDGGRASARAVAEARPLLAHADLVEAVVVDTGRSKKADALPGADLARHLARHEKTVELRRLVPASGEGIVDVLLREVAARDIDIVVMGGYGHSRLREFVLGGVTRDMLERMTVPLFLAH